MEFGDNIEINVFENDKLNKSIRNSLLNDINHDEINYILYKNYIKTLTNKVNFVEDIYRVPHIGNNLALSNPFEDLDILNNRLSNKNLLHKQIILSMNKITIIKELLKKEKEKEMKQLMKIIEFKSKKKLKNNDSSEKIINKYEAKFQHFELTDYFWKYNNYAIINFANK